MTEALHSDFKQGLKKAAMTAGIFWLAALLLRYGISPQWQLYWYLLISDVLLMLGTVPLLYATRHRGGLVACIIWVLSIVLALLIPPQSQLIWVPDAALLLGFIPLLFKSRWSWPWLLFGVPTFFIGLILLVSMVLPDEPFKQVGEEVIKVKHHLAEYHPPWTWAIAGFLCSVYGTVRMIKNIVIMLSRKKEAPQTS